MADVGADREDATEGGGGIGRLREVLSCGNIGDDVVQDGYLVVVGANGIEAGRISCGVTATVDEFEGKKAEGRFVVEGSGGQSTSGIRDTTALDLLGQEKGDCGRMGGLTAYL